MSETTKDSEIKALQATNKSVPEYRAVISPKKAEKLIIPSLGTFLKDDPTHTNDEDLIAGAQKNGNLNVVINYELEAKAKEPNKPKEPAKA